MRFSFRAYDYVPPEPGIFAGTAPSGAAAGRAEPPDGEPLRVSLLPAHPLDYPFVEAILDLLLHAPGLTSRLLDERRFPSLELTLPDAGPPWSGLKALGDNRVRVRVAKPSYPDPVALARTRAVGDEGRPIDWLDFYLLLLGCAGLPVPGVPVVFTDLRTNTRRALFVPPGTPVSSLLRRFQEPTLPDEVVLFDHPFVGRKLERDAAIVGLKPHAVIAAASNSRARPSALALVSLMAFRRAENSFSGLHDSTPNEIGTPCQKCLRCVRACPARIWPLMLSALAGNENFKDASAYLPERCLECGLCSYVCPSGIPLLHNIRALKKEVGVGT